MFTSKHLTLPLGAYSLAVASWSLPTGKD